MAGLFFRLGSRFMDNLGAMRRSRQEVNVGGKTASAAQTARAQARQRMVELERERIERQRRIEDAATAVYVAVNKRAAASALLLEAEQDMAAALRAIIAEGTDVDRAARLCDLTPREVRQLTRHRANGHRPGETTRPEQAARVAGPDDEQAT